MTRARRGRGPSARPARSLAYDVVAGPAVEGVLPRPADQEVVPAAAEEDVVPLAPDQPVVAVAAVLRQPDRVGREARGVHRVVAAQRVDREPVVRRLCAGDVYPGAQPEDGNAARAPGDK